MQQFEETKINGSLYKYPEGLKLRSSLRAILNATLESLRSEAEKNRFAEEYQYEYD